MKLAGLFRRLWLFIGAKNKNELETNKEILNRPAKLDSKLIKEVRKLIDKGYL